MFFWKKKANKKEQLGDNVILAIVSKCFRMLSKLQDKTSQVQTFNLRSTVDFSFLSQLWSYSWFCYFRVRWWRPISQSIGRTCCRNNLPLTLVFVILYLSVLTEFLNVSLFHNESSRSSISTPLSRSFECHLHLHFAMDLLMFTCLSHSSFPSFSSFTNFVYIPFYHRSPGDHAHTPKCFCV